MRNFARAILAIVLVALLPGLAGGAPRPGEGEALEERVREVARELRCPVCQNLSVADSPSELAQEMRGVIREQLRAGKTPEEIKTYFVEKYGEWVLLSPRPGGIGRLVWIGPFAGALAGLLVAGLAIRRWSRRRLAAPVAADPALVERALREALEKEEPPPGAIPRSPLETERVRLYAALRELGLDYQAGKLSAQDYAETRRECGAHAAAVLAALESAPPEPAASADRSPSAGATAPAARRRRRAWRLAAGAVFLLAFGVALVIFLSASLRPRPEVGGSPTGDFLTGTGPGGISPDSAEKMAQMEPGRPGDEQAAGAMPAPIAAQIGEYRARLARNPRDVAALLGMADLNLQRQNPKEAIDFYKQVLAIDPDNPEALASIGLIIAGAGNVDEALSIFERVLARNPEDPMALWYKGWILYEGKQDYAAAIQAWERLLATSRLSPEDTDQIAGVLIEARKKLAAPPGSR